MPSRIMSLFTFDIQTVLIWLLTECYSTVSRAEIPGETKKKGDGIVLFFSTYDRCGVGMVV